MRFSQFIVQLSEHTNYNQKTFEREKNLNKKRLSNAITKMEELKPNIIESYNEEIKKETENKNNEKNNNNIKNNNNNNDNQDNEDEKKNDLQRWSNLLPDSSSLKSTNSLDSILDMPTQSTILIPENLIPGFVDKAKKIQKMM